jgi:uncharacterized protein YndB with AHSA1/START domain
VIAYEPLEGGVRLVRVLPAPREAVFHAWTDPDELRRWWGPPGFTTPAVEIDLRVGGGYRIVMQPPEGEPRRLAGTYREVRVPERLVYTWRWEQHGPHAEETLVTVDFRERGEHTEVEVVHTGFPTAGLVEEHGEGWAGCLVRLEELLSNRAGEESHA